MTGKTLLLPLFLLGAVLSFAQSTNRARPKFPPGGSAPAAPAAPAVSGREARARGGPVLAAVPESPAAESLPGEDPRRPGPPESPPAAIPVSIAAVPAEGQKEIGRLTVRTGDTVSLSAFVTGKHVSDWISSNPASIRVDKRGELQGIRVDSGFVSINDDEYISVAVVPREDFYTVQDREISFLPPGSRTGSDSTMDIGEYRTEPTFRLAYRFNNRGETRGASGSNGGIDILARGDNYRWLWTTYGQGGWYYDLNGVRREMVNGRQSSPNGVELRVDPEFVYDQGVPYLQLRHSLQNHGNSPAKGQRFGASADVMMHANDHAPLIRTRYGAYMADAFEKPGLELMFIGEGFGGINPVDTLWLGEWGGGSHLFHIYDDRREDLYGEDSAIGFSFQNIDLAPGETREFVVRFTLARNDFQE